MTKLSQASITATGISNDSLTHMESSSASSSLSPNKGPVTASQQQQQGAVVKPQITVEASAVAELVEQLAAQLQSYPTEERSDDEDVGTKEGVSGAAVDTVGSSAMSAHAKSDKGKRKSKSKKA